MRRINTKILSAVLLALLFLGSFPITAFAAPQSTVVIGNSYTLDSGKTLNDGLFILGGNVNLMSGSTVNGNVILMGGSAQAAGSINGNMIVVGGTLNLASSFVMNGNLTTGGTVVNRDPGAKITGQVNINETGSRIVIPGQVQIPNITTNPNPFFKVVGFFLRLFLWTLLAMVLAMFLPNHLARISQTTLTQPLLSGGLGVLTILIVPIILVLLAITICLIPVSLVGAFLLIIAWVYGLIAIGYELGKRISGMAKQEWHPAISTGLGTLLLMAVLSGIEALIPCVGWVPKVLVALVGLGAVLLTQFGTKEYIPTQSIPAGSSTGSLPPANP